MWLLSAGWCLHAYELEFLKINGQDWTCWLSMPGNSNMGYSLPCPIVSHTTAVINILLDLAQSWWSCWQFLCCGRRVHCQRFWRRSIYSEQAVWVSTHWQGNSYQRTIHSQNLYVILLIFLSVHLSSNCSHKQFSLRRQSYIQITTTYKNSLVDWCMDKFSSFYPDELSQVVCHMIKWNI